MSLGSQPPLEGVLDPRRDVELSSGANRSASSSDVQTGFRGKVVVADQFPERNLSDRN